MSEPFGSTVVSVRGLTKRFGTFEAVSGISFDVANCEIFGFLGPNGAGKSTTISMLCTLARPTSGDAVVAGHSVVSAPFEVRRRIGLVFQEPTLDEYLTAAENLRFHAQLYGVPRSALAAQIELVLEIVGLADRRDHRVRTFSGGMKRRLEIARGLIHSPHVLFLDEPTVGLDPQTRASIWAYINDLRSREAMTIFLTTHYLEEAENCDRIAIMDRGDIVALDTPNALRASIGTDRVELEVDDPQAAAQVVEQAFQMSPTCGSRSITFHGADGDRLIPRLFELGFPINAIRVARPTLDDVFLAYTGRTIRDSESSAGEQLRSHPFVRGRR